jgi:ATP-binding cassette subfamily F protein uup
MVRSCLSPFEKLFRRSIEFSQKRFVSFHSCYSIEALSESLSEWGEEEGAIVVISHDKSFCDKVGFTHVATVKDGALIVEQRNPTDADWDSSDQTLQRSAEEEELPQETKESKEVDSKVRKQVFNASKRVPKIEELVDQKEERIATLEAEMLDIGDEYEKLVNLTKEKEKLEKEVNKLMKEWDQLEELLLQVA